PRRSFTTNAVPHGRLEVYSDGFLQRLTELTMDLCDLLGTELPIIQAPMAGAQNHELAAAVCAAGGLGSIPAGMLDAQALEAELSAIEALTDRPYNVNFFCHETPTVDPA